MEIARSALRDGLIRDTAFDKVIRGPERFPLFNGETVSSTSNKSSPPNRIFLVIEFPVDNDRFPLEESPESMR